MSTQNELKYYVVPTHRHVPIIKYCINYVYYTWSKNTLKYLHIKQLQTSLRVKYCMHVKHVGLYVRRELNYIKTNSMVLYTYFHIIISIGGVLISTL